MTFQNLEIKLRLTFWSGGSDSWCTIPLHSKKQINIVLTFDFDIHTFGWGWFGDFHFILCCIMSAILENQIFVPCDDSIELFIILDTV